MQASSSGAVPSTPGGGEGGDEDSEMEVDTPTAKQAAVKGKRKEVSIVAAGSKRKRADSDFKSFVPSGWDDGEGTVLSGTRRVCHSIPLFWGALLMACSVSSAS